MRHLTGLRESAQECETQTVERVSRISVADRLSPGFYLDMSRKIPDRLTLFPYISLSGTLGFYYTKQAS